MTSGPCLRGCRVVRRYMPTNIGNHSSVVKDECNNYVSMYFEPLEPLGPVNTGVPPSGGTYVPQTQVRACLRILSCTACDTSHPLMFILAPLSCSPYHDGCVPIRKRQHYPRPSE